MNKIKFSKDAANFDTYDRFWINTQSFLHFETGEVAYTNHTPDPSNRRHYADFGVTLFMPGDTHAPKVHTPEGQLIPAAQFSNGLNNPYLLWDHRQNMVVALGRLNNNTTVPRDLRRFCCYWAADDSKPVATRLAYAPPNVLTPEQKVYAKHCQDVIATVLAMRQDNPELIKLGVTHKGPRQNEIQAAIEKDISPMLFMEQFTTYALESMRGGFVGNMRRTTVEIPYGVTK